MTWPSGPRQPQPSGRVATAGTAAPAGRAATAGRSATGVTKKRPLYVRLLRLRHIAPNAVQRALLGEGSVAVAVLLVLADLASAWTLLVLPLAVAGVVKANDGLAGLLERPPRGRPDTPARAGKPKQTAARANRRRRAGRS